MNSKRFIQPVGLILDTKPEWNLALVKLQYQELTISTVTHYNSSTSSNYTTQEVTLSEWRTGAFVARILNRGGWHTKDYFNYEVGAQVCCIYQEGEGLTDEMYNATYDWRHNSFGYPFMGGGAYIAGSYFNVNDLERRPQADGDNWRLTFPNGSEIFYKGDEGELHINMKGDIVINGRTVNING